MHFVNDLHIVKNNLFDTPPVFNIIQENSGTKWEEMYKVFNMGHRLELYVPAEAAQNIIAVANKYHIDAQVIGNVQKGSKKLTIQSQHGTFEY